VESDAAQIAGLILGGTISAGTPVLYAAVGEIVSERAGIVNLGIEGGMLLGAVSAAWVQLTTGNLFLAILASATIAAALGLLHGVLVEFADVGMLASGLCLFFVGRGLSAFFGEQFVGQLLTGLAPLRIPILSHLPILGEALFHQDALVYIAVVLAACAWYFLVRTRWGLLVRSCGENAQVAFSEGVPVQAIRIAAVAFGSALAGLGGAYIALVFAHTWLQDLTAGRGWVALGLVIVARWNPLYAIPAAYLFGGVISLQLNAQAAGIPVSPYFASALPYLVAIIFLVAAQAWIRSSATPAELTRVGK